jgi:hypothetical protein
MAMSEENSEEMEGRNLLGTPNFIELDNGRFKCVETGHELLAKDKESYSQSKKCRLGLIDFALSHKKPPLNMFNQDPLARSKLICKLTGHTINKSEEHIWKHINGKRFLNKLEEKEAQKQLTPNGMVEEMDEQTPQKVSKSSVNGEKIKKKKKKDKPVEEVVSEVRRSSNEESDSEDAGFWEPPAGERWDFDDGGHRWGSGSESEQESDEENGTVEDGEDGKKESEELSKQAKRMSIEIGPSSFASRKKKSKKDSS